MTNSISIKIHNKYKSITNLSEIVDNKVTTMRLDFNYGLLGLDTNLIFDIINTRKKPLRLCLLHIRRNVTKMNKILLNLLSTNNVSSITLIDSNFDILTDFITRLNDNTSIKHVTMVFCRSMLVYGTTFDALYLALLKSNKTIGWKATYDYNILDKILNISNNDNDECNGSNECKLTKLGINYASDDESSEEITRKIIECPGLMSISMVDFSPLKKYKREILTKPGLKHFSFIDKSLKYDTELYDILYESKIEKIRFWDFADIDSFKVNYTLTDILLCHNKRISNKEICAKLEINRRSKYRQKASLCKLCCDLIETHTKENNKLKDELIILTNIINYHNE